MGRGMDIVQALVDDYGLEIGLAPKNILAGRLQTQLDAGADLGLASILAPLGYAAPGHTITPTIINELRGEHPGWFGGEPDPTEVSLDVGSIGMDGNDPDEADIDLSDMDDVILTDDADVGTNVSVIGFSNGDVIQVSNADDGDYFFTNDGEDVLISYNNVEEGVVNMITLVGVVSVNDIIDGTESSFESVMGGFDLFQLV